MVSEHDEHAIDAAAAVLTTGGTVVLPTDTIYGVAALATDLRAVGELYRLKGRPDSVPIALLVAGPDQLEPIAEPPSPPVARLLDTFWPGPLTVVLPRRDGQGTVGLRCPDRAFVRALAQRIGPLAVTSANRHGAPTPVTAREAAGSLDGEVGLVVDGGRCDGVASTVVDGTDETLPVLRAGPIRPEDVAAVALR